MLARPLRVLDVFAGGCGGWSLGLHWAGGFETVAMCEIEEDRRAMLAHNFPGARLYADIRELTAARLRRDRVGKIDVLVGSPPCQGASAANQKGRGVEGERTKLVFEQTRLIRELRPAFFGFENGSFLIRRGVDRVLDELEADGYACVPLRLEARAFGAPHVRERLFVLGWNADEIVRLSRQWKRSGAGGRPKSDGVSGRARGDTEENGPREGGTKHGGASDCARRPANGRGSTEGPDRSDAAQESARPSGQSRSGVRFFGARGADSRCPWGRDWTESLSGHASSFDGISGGLAKRAAEMYGDAIVPQIAEACGRAFKAVIDAALEQSTGRADRRAQKGGAALV